MYILEENSDVAIEYNFFDGDPDVAMEYLFNKRPIEYVKNYKYSVKKDESELEISFGRGDPNPIVVLKKNGVPVLSSETLEGLDPKLVKMWSYASTRKQEDWFTWIKRQVWWFFFKVNNKCS